jgi:hypothetical protein
MLTSHKQFHSHRQVWVTNQSIANFLHSLRNSWSIGSPTSTPSCYTTTPASINQTKQHFSWPSTFRPHPSLKMNDICGASPTNDIMKRLCHTWKIINQNTDGLLTNQSNPPHVFSPEQLVLLDECIFQHQGQQHEPYCTGLCRVTWLKGPHCIKIKLWHNQKILIVLSSQLKHYFISRTTSQNCCQTNCSQTKQPTKVISQHKNLSFQKCAFSKYQIKNQGGYPNNFPKRGRDSSCRWKSSSKINQLNQEKWLSVLIEILTSNTWIYSSNGLEDHAAPIKTSGSTN